MKASRTAACLLASQVVVVPAFAASPGHYTIFDVQGAGTESGQGTYADSLNAGSSVTGYYFDSSFFEHGFVRAPDGTITAFDVAGPSSETQPMTIDRKGEIGGFYLKPKKQMFDNGFLRQNSGRIEKFAAGGVNTGVNSLNDNGDAVGSYATKNHRIFGYVRAADGTITSFQDSKGGKGEFEGTFPSDINNAGVITGQYTNQHRAAAFVRDADGTFENFNVHGAGALGVSPASINQRGTVVGSYFDSNQALHAFIRDPAGTIRTFDAPGAGTGSYQGTSAASVADDGTIAGTYVDANNVGHGFLRLKDGSIEEFDTPGAGTGSGDGTFSDSINKTDIIAGYEVDKKGVAHGFLRTP